MPDVNNLSGVALDYAVALAVLPPESFEVNLDVGAVVMREQGPNLARPVFSPSQYWDQGGPKIDRERIQLCPPDQPVHRNYGSGVPRNGVQQSGMWTACTWSNRCPDGRRSYAWGETALVAAMRCFVRLKFGDTVDIPQEVLDAKG